MSWTKFQVQKTLIDAYLSINASMMKVMAKAETAISEAQDRNKESPFIDSALEQIKSATTELNNAMKRVSEKEFFWESKHCNFHLLSRFLISWRQWTKAMSRGKTNLPRTNQRSLPDFPSRDKWRQKLNFAREGERESAFFCNVLSDKIQNNSLCQGLGFWEIVLLYFLWAVCNLQAKLQNNSEIG